MSSTVTVTEEEVPLTESEKLEKDKKREMKTRSKKEEEKKRQSKCNALGKLGSAGLVMALGLLGHEIGTALEQNKRLEQQMINYVSVPENTVANMTTYIKELEKTNAELVKAKDTLDKLIKDNPTSKTQPYSKEVWLRKKIAEASGEEVPEEEDTSKAVVKASGARKKGGYFNEHFSLNF